MTPTALRRVARVLAWVTVTLSTLALLPAVLKGDGFAPALAGLAVGLAVLVTTRERRG